MKRKTICTSQTIVLMIVAIVVGLGFVAAVVVISIGKNFDVEELFQ